MGRSSRKQPLFIVLLSLKRLPIAKANWEEEGVAFRDGGNGLESLVLVSVVIQLNIWLLPSVTTSVAQEAILRNTTLA